MKRFSGGWSITFVCFIILCVIIGFMLAVQFHQVQDAKETLSGQRVEELAGRLIKVEDERDELQRQLELLRYEAETSTNRELITELKLQACVLPLTGEGVIIKMDDSTHVAKAGENPNVYLIHDDDLLRVINELRAAGAEAIAVNGQRLIATSEIRCAGPTLSVNNVRTAAPYEICAIGDKKSLENAIKMRGGVADTLKVWGIQLEVNAVDNVAIPPYKGITRRVYSRIAEDNL